MPNRKKQSYDVVHYCHNCQTDLRFTNIKYHKDLGHRIEERKSFAEIQKDKKEFDKLS